MNLSEGTSLTDTPGMTAVCVWCDGRGGSSQSWEFEVALFRNSVRAVCAGASPGTGRAADMSYHKVYLTCVLLLHRRIGLDVRVAYTWIVLSDIQKTVANQNITFLPQSCDYTVRQHYAMKR